MIRRTIFVTVLVAIAAPVFAEGQTPKVVQDDPIGHKLSERVGPFIETIPVWFPNDTKRGAWEKEYGRLTLDEKVHYCIFQLQAERWCEMDRHFLYSDELYSTEPEATASRELIKLGRSAIPQLIVALNSPIPTEIHPTRHRLNPWLVQDVAMDVIEHIACRSFGDESLTYELSDIDEKERHRLRKKVADWWEKNKAADKPQWAKEVLFSEAGVRGGNRDLAIDSLFRRLGKESNPYLAKAYRRLPKGRENAEGLDETAPSRCKSCSDSGNIPRRMRRPYSPVPFEMPRCLYGSTGQKVFGRLVMRAGWRRWSRRRRSGYSRIGGRSNCSALSIAIWCLFSFAATRRAPARPFTGASLDAIPRRIRTCERRRFAWCHRFGWRRRFVHYLNYSATHSSLQVRIRQAMVVLNGRFRRNGSAIWPQRRLRN